MSIITDLFGSRHKRRMMWYVIGAVALLLVVYTIFISLV